jgi:hypothetical protein
VDASLPGVVASAMALVSTLTVGGASAANMTTALADAVVGALVTIGMNPAAPWLALAVLLTVAPVMWSLRLMRA